LKKDKTLNTKEIIGLINHPLINRAELARRMFPHNKTPEQALQAKLINTQNKRITHQDCENVIQILKTEIVNKIQKELS
jgi:hypothetical protein